MKLLLFTILALAATGLQAFTLNSSSNSGLKGWEGGDVKIYFNSANCPAGVDVAGLITDAARVWNNVPTSTIKVSYGGTTTGTTSSSPPTIYCETNFDGIAGGPDSNFVPGAASVQAPNGQITSGLIFLNATSGQANVANYNRTVITIILAHEIGHLLGLGHSTSKNALMYYDASEKTTLRLAQDDIDGMSYLYPSDELSGGKVAGCGLVKNLAPPGPGSSTFLFLMMMLPLLLTIRLRQRKNFISLT